MHTLTLSCAVIQRLLGQTDGEMMIMLPLVPHSSHQGTSVRLFFNKDINDPHEARIPIGERDRERERKKKNHSNAYHCDCLQPGDKMAINKRCSGSRRGDNMHSYLHVCMFICAWQTPSRSGMHSPLSQGVKLLDGSAHTLSDSYAT